MAMVLHLGRYNINAKLLMDSKKFFGKKIINGVDCKFILFGVCPFNLSLV